MRLIDADALKESIDKCDICDICPDKAIGCSYDCGFPDALDYKWEKLIDAQPTIEVPKWIPCSERLPSAEGWYFVTIENDKTKKRRAEQDLFAVEIAINHGHQPYKFCKDGYRQTVIAWMPLPQPYKETDHE